MSILGDLSFYSHYDIGARLSGYLLARLSRSGVFGWERIL